ncbi:MAG: hypothetical protein U5K00_12795 [Melioribacteraceae bacterium]|nr:hypothetical protein [Melioribacteraceae bacterium]
MIKQVFTIYGGFLLIFLILSLFEVIEWSLFNTALLAIGLNIPTTYSAYYFFNKSLGKTNNEFLLFNLGGMMIRLFFLLVVVFIVIKFLNIDKYAFIFLFFIFYFTSLIFEVNYFRIKAKEQGKAK